MRLFAIALSGLLTACGQGPHLEGSVTSLLDLRYEGAQAVGTQDELSVRFFTRKGASEDTILKVSASLEDLEYAPGQSVDLAQLLDEEPDSAQRGTVSRSVLDEPVRDFPRLTRGTLTFDEALQPGATVSGEFRVTFVNGTDVYSGRTIFGRFEATVP
ncbi:hypothetical protein [Hyalangium rubrum]|uniref:Lipoprotein n=1 Tax=Hyalangium rubrum TaxID=3103134 RepID=A0ABU5H1A0_9BACT|nr:hypothetical protein [Hyalangium sp. s54d21]MDY7226542.1 hypothetical protein [Hyalangium sp. s54d21]